MGPLGLPIALYGWAILWAAQAAPATAPQAARSIDDFENHSIWSAHPADGVELALHPDTGVHGKSLRLDFNFVGGGGYAVARRALDLDLPANYVFTFQVRGLSPPNHLEFKLIDSTGTNVWWSVKRDYEFPSSWETFRIRKRQIQFAWGPLGGGEVRHAAALEIAITAGKGGKGSVWLDDLVLQPLDPPLANPPAPVARASSESSRYAAARALDGEEKTGWRSAANDTSAWLALDLGTTREYGGITLRWEAARHAPDYAIEASEDGARWRVLREIRGANGNRDDLYLPESESRWVRLRALGRRGSIAIQEVVLRPLEWSASRTAFFESIARDAARGSYPRGMSGEQSYWTVVGIDADSPPSLLDEDGRLETGGARFSIEPFLWIDGRLVGWKDVRSEQRLDDDWMPIPSVRWKLDKAALDITAFGTGERGRSAVVGRYRITNQGKKTLRGALFLAARPFQVNPPSQTLNDPGGATRVRNLQARGSTLLANGARAVVSLQAPAAFGATTFDGGHLVDDFLRAGQLPRATEVGDPFEAASGAWRYPFSVAPGSVHEVDLWIPLHGDPEPPVLDSGATGHAWVQSQLDAQRRIWQARAGRTTVRLPENAGRAVQSLYSQLGTMLVTRAGPALQPGARAYFRAWIRDGAMMSAALLRLGHHEAARQFLEWYAPHQYPNGKIPCVVDQRGADPVPEHDSSGEFIYLVAEYDRLTGKREVATRLWPRVRAAADYLDALRHERRTPEYAAPDKREFYGLLPPSISHEGYSAKPMHSYWDVFWAVRGFRDAVYLARELGHERDAAQLEAIAQEFETDVAASIEVAMRRHSIDYIPGCADLGDFDATSTTIALNPTNAASFLPSKALHRTFEKYDGHFRERAGGATWDAFTPYEIRNIGAFVRLGWRDRAQELLAYFLDAQRPVGWRQWPEVVWREARVPRFLGDLPHTWVGSDYVRSFVDMLAYESEPDESLVLGAGVPRSWVEGTGLEVRDLRTRWGNVSYTMQAQGDSLLVAIEAGLRVPRGGIEVRVPEGFAAAHPEERVRSLPARLVRRR